MLRQLLRIGDGVTRRDSGYFKAPSDFSRHSHFREDLRAIVGGALAAAFLAAAFAGYVPNSWISDTVGIASAAVAGGIAGKLFLV